MRDFDISPDGRELVLEQVQDHSDIVLLELPPAMTEAKKGSGGVFGMHGPKTPPDPFFRPLFRARRQNTNFNANCNCRIGTVPRDRIDRAERAAAGSRYRVVPSGGPIALSKVGVGIGEIRSVQQVERFDPKLNVLAAAKVEILQRREIDRKHSRPGERGAAEIAKGSERGHLKRGDVEPGGGAGFVQTSGLTPATALGRS